jgi:hypothetical protein
MGFSTYLIHFPWDLLKFDVEESLTCVSFFPPHLSKASYHQTGTGRQHPEGLLFAAECKRNVKTSRGRISESENFEEARARRGLSRQ